MSEYQYYEFLAVDRALSKEDREELRALSSRAEITATRFTNTYEWGDFKGDPVKLMERWFDLHIYLANWGSRRLMIRLPAKLLDRRAIDRALKKSNAAQVVQSGENLILDIRRDDEDGRDWIEGSGWIAELAPLRTALAEGDPGVLYLAWLIAVEEGDVPDAKPEPFPGLGPLTPALDAFARFFNLDPDLVAAAAERSAVVAAPGAGAARDAIAKMEDHEKTELLTRLYDGDPHVGTELRIAVRTGLAAGATAPALPPRTAGDLRARAEALRQEEAEKAAAAAERARRRRLDPLIARGEAVWEDVENEILQRTNAAYDRAVALLADLQIIAVETRTQPLFERRLQAIRERHSRKGQFLLRLDRRR